MEKIEYFNNLENFLDKLYYYNITCEDLFEYDFNYYIICPGDNEFKLIPIYDDSDGTVDNLMLCSIFEDTNIKSITEVFGLTLIIKSSYMIIKSKR